MSHRRFDKNALLAYEIKGIKEMSLDAKDASD
jgi:hypothetical protein